MISEARAKPRRVFDSTDSLFEALPFLDGVFPDRVPLKALSGDEVKCTCGASTKTSDTVLAECEGECGLWFLSQDGVISYSRVSG